MKKRTMWQRMAGLATVMGLSAVVPFTVGAVPAYAVGHLNLTKTHQGDFARGGVGSYEITVTVTDEFVPGGLIVDEDLPFGLTLADVSIDTLPDNWTCEQDSDGFSCEIGNVLMPGFKAVFTVVVNVSPNAPCSVTNRASAHIDEGTAPLPAPVSVTDPTTITGGECDDAGGGDGSGSILPVNLSGVIPMFNNISINNPVLSPNASSRTHQDFGLNAP
ncbi:hypothetical protein [Streptomyces racemochromogenes]|uniref:hypothetical protein n=1 Tax=Streptomyces racemochromogenes TaxID=67353 RepID=UPI0035EEE4C3